jgi:flagellar biosynthetic protein FliP
MRKLLVIAALAIAIAGPAVAHAQAVSAPAVPAAAAAPDAAPSIGTLLGGESTGPRSAIHLIVILALASLAPAIILTATCFARFAIVFSFARTGLGTQGAPPSQILIGLSLFMTLFVMAPVAGAIYRDAGEPYLADAIDEQAALDAATPHIRTFLLERTRAQDLELFYEVSGASRPSSPDDVPLRIAVPAFVVSELTIAFKIGLIILLPFLIIDLVVAAVLSSLGMIMLPPPIVALPIKLLVFVAVDGWHLLVSSLLAGVM